MVNVAAASWEQATPSPQRASQRTSQRVSRMNRTRGVIGMDAAGSSGLAVRDEHSPVAPMLPKSCFPSASDSTLPGAYRYQPEPSQSDFSGSGAAVEIHLLLPQE